MNAINGDCLSKATITAPPAATAGTAVTLEEHTKHLQELNKGNTIPHFRELSIFKSKLEAFAKVDEPAVLETLSSTIKAGHIGITQRLLAEAVVLPRHLQLEYAMMMMKCPPSEVVQMHNYFVARQYERRPKTAWPNWAETYSKEIMAASTPFHMVWYNDKEAETQNEIIMNATALRGAGVDTDRRKSFGGGTLAGDGTRRQAPRGGEVTGGAFKQPVEANPDGTLYVDLGPAEDALRAMQTTQSQMNQVLNQLVRNQNSQQRPPHQQQNEGSRGNDSRRHNGSRGGYGGNRGRTNGRGYAGPRGAGEETQEQSKDFH
jgi:hypothetical protein